MKCRVNTFGEPRKTEPRQTAAAKLHRSVPCLAVLFLYVFWYGADNFFSDKVAAVSAFIVPAEPFLFKEGSGVRSLGRILAVSYSVRIYLHISWDERYNHPRPWSDRITSWPVKPTFSPDIIHTDSADVSTRCFACPGRLSETSLPSLLLVSDA